MRGQPLATWLPGKYQLPLLGPWLHLKEVALLFSWLGCLYDLTIWLFLWWRKSRGLAYVAVLAFHLLTYVLFPRIGMFPAIMICGTLIFFSEGWHQRVLSWLPGSSFASDGPTAKTTPLARQKLITYGLGLYLAVQLCLPLRYLAFPGNLFWHEQGYRFSWRVMLMEKNGYTSVILRDPATHRQHEVRQEAYLTPFQRQQMRS
ncbi:MAG TPA: HTTM domain-containing protein, partial [Cytophagales bacterium]|nr:HTTM domain-containing protein [Cytophagales bacterium]